MFYPVDLQSSSPSACLHGLLNAPGVHMFSFILTPNLQLLPSFASQDLLPDGRFLTPVAGLHYLLHLFDQTEGMIKTANISGDAKLELVREQVRHHEDRMAYLENRHSGLQKQVCIKVAVDAEFNDWMQNRGDEDWFVVRGLPRLNVSRSAWPDAARRQVADMIKLVLHASRTRLDFEVVNVFNPFSRTTTPHSELITNSWQSITQG